MFSVRQAGPDDAAALHALAEATFRLACPPGTLEQDMADFIATHLSAERMSGYLADPERELFLAIGPDGPLGYTMIVHAEPTDPDVAAAITVRPTAELSKCYVLSAAHGTGAASALVNVTIDAARRRGAGAVWLGVNQHNPRAHRFYEKSGFTLVGTKHFLVGDQLHDDFVRERVL